MQVAENRRALDRVTEAIGRFKAMHGMFPSVVYVGEEVFKRAFPYQVFPKASAIGQTLVLQKLELDRNAVVIMKPPELRTDAA